MQVPTSHVAKEDGRAGICVTTEDGTPVSSQAISPPRTPCVATCLSGLVSCSWTRCGRRNRGSRTAEDSSSFRCWCRPSVIVPVLHPHELSHWTSTRCVVIGAAVYRIHTLRNGDDRAKVNCSLAVQAEVCRFFPEWCD